jgi:hypothetical protein
VLAILAAWLRSVLGAAQPGSAAGAPSSRLKQEVGAAGSSERAAATAEEEKEPLPAVAASAAGAGKLRVPAAEPALAAAALLAARSRPAAAAAAGTALAVPPAAAAAAAAAGPGDSIYSLEAFGSSPPLQQQPLPLKYSPARSSAGALLVRSPRPSAALLLAAVRLPPSSSPVPAPGIPPLPAAGRKGAGRGRGEEASALQDIYQDSFVDW